MKVLVTGATGRLGRELLPRLRAAGHYVKATSRRPGPAQEEGTEWVSFDPITAEGLPSILAGMDAIVHCINVAGRGGRSINVAALEPLLVAAAKAGTSHLIYPSIVGIEKTPSGYYRQKLAAEALVERAAVPSTIARATQFHSLLDRIFRGLSRFPMLMPVAAGAQLQPVDAGEYAQSLIYLLAKGPGGRAPDFAGPRILQLEQAARRWLGARRLSRRVFPLPLPGKLGRALRAGSLTNRTAPHGDITWEEWLEDAYAEGRS